MMNKPGLPEQLAFVIEQRRQDEAVVLAEAMRAGIQALYLETLIEAYLLGRVSREVALQALGPERLGEIEYQRDVLREDVAWGLEYA